MRLHFERAWRVRRGAKPICRLAPGLAALTLIVGSCLSGCGGKDEPAFATLTLKRDGSHFRGIVVRREPNSITLQGPGGDTHTFLYSEVDIWWGTPSDSPHPSGSTAQAGTVTSASAAGPGNQPAGGRTARPLYAGAAIRLPAGVVLPVTNAGIVDSSFFDTGIITLGTTDTDVKAADGGILIPQGANVTMLVRDMGVVAGRIQMELELASADFDNRHYVISSEKGGLEPGAVVTYTGPLPGTQEAKLKGLQIHFDERSLMMFKTETPTVFKVSE